MPTTLPLNQILIGDCRELIKTLPDESVNCAVTSPPYWGLRSYGTEPQVWANGHEPCVEHQWGDEGTKRNRWGLDKNLSEFQANQKGNAFEVHLGTTCSVCGAWRGELGLEPTPEFYVEHITQIFREVRRVLRDDGTLWLNLGDSYVGGKGANNHRWSVNHLERETLEKEHHHLMVETGRPCDNMQNMKQSNLKPKDLVGIPWMVAFALRADGWYLRSDIIWSKPNPMPESVTDRPTKAHEYIFLLSKSQKYYYDAAAIAEPSNGWNGSKFDDERDLLIRPNTGRGHRNIKGNMSERGVTRTTEGLNLKTSAEKTHETRNRRTVWTVEDERALLEWLTENYPDTAQAFFSMQHERKDVWQIATHPFKGAHFATFPPKLIEPCILAGTSARGVCSKCGAPWERVTERVEPSYYQERKEREFGGRKVEGNDNYTSISKGRPDNSGVGYNSNITTGWRPTCACDAGEPVPAVVLDPFMGSGTTASVCISLKRHYIGFDLNPAYVEGIAQDRADMTPPPLFVL